MRSDRTLFPHARLAAALLFALPLAACQTGPGTTPAAPAPVQTTAGDPTSFWEHFQSAKILRTDDALRALAELGQLEHADSLSHADRVKAMRDKGWIGAKAELPPEAPATRGQVAAILCPMLGIQGGVSLRMSSFQSMRERYATRELVDLGLLPAGSSPEQTLSGLEFLRTLSFAERHLEAH